MHRITQRSEYLRVAKDGARVATKGLVVQALPVSDSLDSPSALRVGITVSSKVGNAVIRNRAKRRLRALARLVLTQEAKPGVAYVLIGRQDTPVRPYAMLIKDLRYALHALGLHKRGARG